MMKENSKKKLPNCFHIGMPKSGSKFLNNLLKQHPGLVLNHGQKNFYAAQFGKGFDWYLSQFNGNEEKLRVDLSPRLFMEGEEAASRVKKHVNNPRFLLILRNPSNFVFSYYRMHYNKGIFTRNYRHIFKRNPSFDSVLAKFPEYLDRGQYYKTFKVWLGYFRLSQFKVIIFEEFVKEPQKHMDEICEFFGIQKIQFNQVKETSKNITLKNPFFYKIKRFIIKREKLKNKLKHSGFLDRIFDFFLAKPTQIPDNYKRKLQEYYKEDTKCLSELLGVDLSAWME